MLDRSDFNQRISRVLSTEALDELIDMVPFPDHTKDLYVPDGEIERVKAMLPPYRKEITLKVSTHPTEIYCCVRSEKVAERAHPRRKAWLKMQIEGWTA